jgi:hypothetical protein
MLFNSLDKEEIARSSAPERLKIITQHNWGILIPQIGGAISAILLLVWFFSDSILHFFGISLPVKLNELQFFATPAFADASSQAQSITVHSGTLEMKSLTLGGIIFALFVWFVWSLITLYRSPNPDAVGVAVESIKMLGGFFIGAVTGLLGSTT